TEVRVPGTPTITDEGSGNFHATLAWDPPDATTVVGLYDLRAVVRDQHSEDGDTYGDNANELQVTASVDRPPSLVPGALRATTLFVQPGGAGGALELDFFDPDL